MNEINSWIIGAMVIAYAIVIYRQFTLSEQNKDLWNRLRAQMEIDADLDRKLNIEQGLRYDLQGALTDERTKLNQANKSLGEAINDMVKLKEENGNLKLQVTALCKDVESLRSFNSDMHRVIDMDSKKLKDKERIIAEQQTKIDRLMKIRKK